MTGDGNGSSSAVNDADDTHSKQPIRPKNIHSYTSASIRAKASKMPRCRQRV